MGDYNPSPEIQKLWKEFGCDTSSGRLLRQLYNGRPPIIAYPKIFKQEENPSAKKEPPKPCPQRAYVSVPSFKKKPPKSTAPIFTGGKKSLDTIHQETNDFTRALEPAGPRGKNRQKMTTDLQDNHTYGRGSVLPKGAMGHGAACPKEPRSLPEKKALIEIEDPGDLSKQDAELFEEICTSLKKKQEELRTLKEKQPTFRPADVHRCQRQRVFLAKEQLRLKEEIANDMKDLKKVLVNT